MTSSVSTTPVCNQAFHDGFSHGVREGMLIAGSVVVAISFVVAVGFRALNIPLREVIHPIIIQKQKDNLPGIVAVQSFLNHKAFDKFFAALGFFCNLEFYITFLPFLFWIGETSLARNLSIIMGLCMYSGNALKDMLCAPRPASPPVRRANPLHEHHLEYGCPSTHTINITVMTAYIWAFLYKHNYPTELVWTSGVLFSLMAPMVMIGRVQLGLHSFIDIQVGFVMALGSFIGWMILDEYVDWWIISGTGVVYFQLLMTMVLCIMYPTPMRPNPSYKYAVYFTGVVLGIVVASNRVALRVFPEEMLQADRHVHVATKFGGSYVLWALCRFLVGMPLVGLSMVVGKYITKTCLTTLFTLMKIPYSTSDERSQDPKEWNVLVAVRLLSFAIVSWTVVEPTYYTFYFLGI